MRPDAISPLPLRRLQGVVMALGLTLMAVWALSANAHEYTVGSLTIEHPWARPSMGPVPNGAAYLTVKNEGTEADRLVAARGEVAANLELHSMSMDDGVMRMRMLPEGIEIPAGETVTLAPRGLHIMLLGLAEPLEVGDLFKVTLVFERAGEMEAHFIVKQPDATVGQGGHQGHQGH